MIENRDKNLLALTADMVASYVSNNNLSGDDLPRLIQSTHAALAVLASSPDAAGVPSELEFKPAVTVRKSLASPDHIISMIDGQPYRILSRHLTKHGLTFAAYKERYNLPANYPSTAPAYSEARRKEALKRGLGRKIKRPSQDLPPGRGRGRKVTQAPSQSGT